MSKPQFLILCCIFCIPSTFALFNDIEKAGNLLSRVIQRLNRTNSSYDQGHLYSEGIQAAREFLGNLKQLNSYKIPESDIFIQLDGALNPIPRGSLLDWEARTAAFQIDKIFDDFVNFLDKNADNSSEKIKNTNLGSFAPAKDALFASILEVRDRSDNYLGFFWPLVLDINSDYFHCGWLQDEQNYLINFYKTLILSEIKEYLRVTVMATILGGPNALHERVDLLASVMNSLQLEYTKAFSNSLKVIEPQYFRFCNLRYNRWISEVTRIDLRASLQQVHSESTSENRGNDLHYINSQWRVYVGRLESKASDNYVVTGIRFQIKENVSLRSILTPGVHFRSNILYLQPAQGKLYPNGTITNYEWVPLPDYIPEEDTADLDFNHRSFFLDDVQLDPQYAMTGIKFDAIERGDKKKINGFAISVSGVPLDYKSGKLNLTLGNKRYVRSVPAGIENELIYKNVRPSDMEASKQIQKSSPRHFTYITLQPSDDTDNWGQSTLPLFDATPVVMRRHSPLSGTALFHKHSEDDAGFISVKVRPLNYVPYVDALIKRYQNRGTRLGWLHYLRSI